MVSQNFTDKERDILLSGLTLYKKEVAKMLKKAGDIKFSKEKEIKLAFLETESLINRFTTERE